jgi:pimeloyl-ACP methyl ester carboxylesterase
MLAKGKGARQLGAAVTGVTLVAFLVLAVGNRGSPGVVNVLVGSTDILARTLPQLQTRVSAIYGEHDALYRGRLPELQGAMQNLSPKWGQWHTVTGAGHWVQFENAPVFNRQLKALLASGHA